MIHQNGKPVTPRKDLPKERDYNLEQNGKKVTHKFKAKEHKPYAIFQNGRLKFGKIDHDKKPAPVAKLHQEKTNEGDWDQEEYLKFVVKHNDTKDKALKILLFKANAKKISPEEARAVKEECKIRNIEV